MTQLSQLSDEDLLKLYNQPAPDDLSTLSDDELLSLAKDTRAREPVGQLQGIVNSGRQGFLSLRQGIAGRKAEAAAGRIADAGAIPSLMEPALAQVPADVPQELLERTAGVRSAMALRAEGQRRLADEAIGELMASADTLQDLEERMQQIQLAPAMEAWNQAEGFAESAAAFLKNPFEITLNIQAQSMVSSVPALALGAAGAAVAGPAGLAAGAGMGSYAVERSLAFLDALRDAGVDLKDKDSILEAFNSPETLAKARAHAIKRGVPVALFDAASGGLAGRFTVVNEGVKKFVKGQAVETGLDMLSGGAGEAAGGLVAEGRISGKDVFAEMLGEIGPGAVETAIGANTEARRTQRREQREARQKVLREALDALKQDPKAQIGQEATDLLQKMKAELEAQRTARAEAETKRREEQAERRRGFPGRLDEALESLGALTPDQLEAVDSNLAFLESRRGITRESVDRLIANTSLKGLSKTAKAFLARDLTDTENLAAMRQAIQRRLPAKDTTAADAAAAAAKQAEAEARALAKKARAAERKRIALMDKTGRDPDTGEVYDYTLLDEATLEGLVEQGDPQAQDEMMRRADSEEAGPAGPAELLETVRSLKLPTPEQAASFNRQGEFATLREHLGKGEALRVFRDQAQTETQILERYREAGFDFESVDALVDALDQRVRDGRPVYAQGVGEWRFAKARQTLQDDNDETVSQDPLTKQPTRITGPSVTSAQVAGIRKAARDRRQAMEDALERGETPEDSQDLLPVIDAILFEEDVNGDNPKWVLRIGSKELEWLGEGSEAEVYYDRENKVVYKILKRDYRGANGYNYHPMVDASGFSYRIATTATALTIARRVEVLNAVLGVPTEIVGQTIDNELILKQPYAEGSDVAMANRDEAIHQMRQVGGIATPPADLDGGRVRRRQGYYNEGLVRPGNPWVIAYLDGRVYLVGDLHTANIRQDNAGRPRIADPIVTEIIPEHLAMMRPTLPETAAWIEQYAIGAGPYAQRAREDLRFARADPPNSPAFKAWSKGLPIVRKGEQLPAGGFAALAYHGTTRTFDAFDLNKANIDGDQGAGLYFSNTPEDVTENYGSDQGADLTGRIEQRADEILNSDESIDYDDAMEMARRELTEHKGAVMPVYVRLEKPLILGGPTETTFDYDYTIDEDTGEVTESGSLLDLVQAIRTVADTGAFYDVNADSLIQDLLSYPEVDGGGSIGASRVEYAFRRSDALTYATDEEGNSAGNEFRRQVWEQLGYDGVADTTVYAKFGRPRQWGRAMDGMVQSTVHFIAFDNRQVKSAIGNSGAYSLTDPDIAAARADDDAGRRKKKPKLTGMQSEAEVARLEAALQEIAPGLAREYRILVGDLQALSEAAGLPLDQLDDSMQAAISTRRRLFWFLRDNVVFDKKGRMPSRLRRDMLHEFAHAFWDTLPPDEQMDLFALWQKEIAEQTGPLYRNKQLRPSLRADIETDVQEWFAERMALQNDAWARGRTTTDSMLADAAARLRAWIEQALQLLARAWGRRYGAHADFRRFMVRGQLPPARPIDTDMLSRRFSGLEPPAFQARRQDPPDQNAGMDGGLLFVNRPRAALKYRGMDYIEETLRRGGGNRDHAYRLLRSYFDLKDYLAKKPPRAIYDQQQSWLDPDQIILEMTGLRNDADADLLLDAIEAYDAGRPFAWPDSLDLSRQMARFASKASQVSEKVLQVLNPQLLRLLTVEELKGLRVDTAARISAAYAYLPPIAELRRMANLAREGRQWYTWVDDTLRAMAPDETSHWQLAGILAATSPSKSVEDSVRITLRVWNGWVAAGKPTDPVLIEQLVCGGVIGHKKWGRTPLGQRGMDSDVNNIVHVLSSESYQQAVGKMTSPKVTPFYRAIMGELDAIVNDTWMARMFDVDKNRIGDVSYNRALNAVTRRLARQLGWDPAEVQAALWMVSRILGDRIRNEAKRQAPRPWRKVIAEPFTEKELEPGDDIATLVTGEKYGNDFAAAGFDTGAGRAALERARKRTLQANGGKPRSGIRVGLRDRGPVTKRLLNRFQLERLADGKELLPFDLRFARAPGLPGAPGADPVGRAGPAVAWPPGFPKVQVQTTVAALRKHPAFAAAKAGDQAAAARLVEDLAKPAHLDGLAAQFPGARVAVVHAEEATGRNKIPVALGSFIERLTGLELDLGLVQAARVGHTDANAIERLLRIPTFLGDVIPGAQYIIVDDVTTSGSTLAGLRRHIIAGEGEVVAATAMAASFTPQTGSGVDLALAPATLEALKSKFDLDELNQLLSTYGIAEEVKGLTNAQGRYIAGFRTLDSFRDRIAAAGFAQQRRVAAGSLGGPAQAEVADDLRFARVDHRAPEPVNLQRLTTAQLDERISALTEEWIRRKQAKRPVETVLDLRDEARTEKDRRLQDRMPPIPGPNQAALEARLEALDLAIEEAQTTGNLAKVANLQNQRREIREQLRQPAPTPTPETDAAADTGEPSPFNDDEKQYTKNRTKIDRLRGASLGRDSSVREALNNLGELLKGFRGSIPEIPTFGSRSRKYTGLKLGLKLLRRGDARVRREAADAVKRVLEPIMQIKGKPLQADAYAKLQRLIRQRERLLGKPKAAAERMLAINKAIADLRERINQDPYIVFQDIALFRDLWFRSQLTDDRGQPLTLPMNLNAEEVQDYLEQLHARLARHPERQAIEESLARHKELADATLKDLLARSLTVPEDYQNPHYFPHIVLEHTKGRLERVRIATEDDFRAYLVKPVGSAKAIETDYIKAMYYHIAAVKAHNLRSDIVANYFQPLDIMEQVRAYAKELETEYGRPVSWREAFNTGFASSHQVYTVDDRLPLHPDLMINREVLGKALGRVLSEGPLGPQLKKLGVEGITVRAQDIHEALAAGEKEVWVLPNEAAEALRGIIKREWPTDNLVTKFMGGVQGLWKRNILFAPWNYIRYEFNNTLADLEKLFSVDPGMARKLPQAFGEVRRFFAGGEPGLALRKAFELGVLESITANEVNAVAELREFEQFATTGQRAISMLRRHSTISASRLREATFRYAKYLADLERMQRGAAPIYAGAYGPDVEAIGDSSEGAGDANFIKAAEISLKTFGDYFDLTVNGNKLRQLLIPFYSWTEVNFKYHANLFRNMADLVREGEITGSQAAGRIAGAVSIRGSRIAAGFALRLALPYLAIMLWNNTGDREELEETLSAEDRRRLHIILGKDDEGRTMVVYLPTAFSDVIKWFSGPTFAQLATDYLAGRVDLPTALGEFARQVPNDAVNNLLQGIGPLYKVPYTLLAKKSVFPDVTDQRTIAAHDMQRVILGQATDQFTAEVITRLVNKDYLASRDVGDWAQQLILQVRRRDPEQWAYYEMRDKADEFLERETGRTRDSNFNAPDQQVLRNFRRSVYRGDVNNALRFYNRLLELGYTSERFDASLRSQNPLSGLPNELKAPFIEQLSPFQSRQLERAMKYYSRIQAAEGYEKALFPAKRNVDYPFGPDSDLLKQVIQDANRMSEDDSQALADQLILEALTK